MKALILCALVLLGGRAVGAAKKLVRDPAYVPSALRGDLFRTVSLEDSADAEPGPLTDEKGQWRFVKEIPFLRKSLGLVLLSVGMPDYLRAYDKQEKRTLPF
jgi:hypothetical protein